MYGLVNQGVKSFIIQNFGESKWTEICKRADVSDDDYTLLTTYPDEITYKLVGAISEELNITSEQALEAYGQYWIIFAAESGYENLLSMFGPDFKSCVQNLDHMHEHMGSFMPGIKAPSFKMHDSFDNTIIVDYISERSGLASFVKGLLVGLLKRYQEEGVVSILEEIDSGYRFRVDLKR